MKLTNRVCPLCSSSAARNVWTHSQLQFYSDEVASGSHFDVSTVQCSQCFTVFQNPAPNPAQQLELFSEAGMSYGSVAGRHDEQIEWLSARGLLREQPLVLDIGCYDGSFLSKMPINVRRSGLDIDAAAIERARDADPGGEYLLSSFENLELGDVKPQIVTLFHVIEHVFDPVSLLLKLNKQVPRDCNLLIEVPIIENARVGDINGFFSVQHMTHFSRNSLRGLISLSGWEVIEWFEAADYNGTRVLCRPVAQVSPWNPQWEDVLTFMEYTARWQASIAQALKRAEKAFDSDLCFVWGAGMHTELLFALGQFRSHIPRVRLVDREATKVGKTWRGVTVENPDILLSQQDWKEAKVLVSSYGSQPEIVKEIMGMEVPTSSIVTLYDETIRY